MKNYIVRPDITFYPGIRVDEKTKLDFKNDKVTQTIENLKLHSIIIEKNDNYECKSELTINLDIGDVIILDNDRGYILPAFPLVTVKEAIEEFECLKEV